MTYASRVQNAKGKIILKERIKKKLKFNGRLNCSENSKW